MTGCRTLPQANEFALLAVGSAAEFLNGKSLNRPSSSETAFSDAHRSRLRHAPPARASRHSSWVGASVGRASLRLHRHVRGGVEGALDQPRPFVELRDRRHDDHALALDRIDEPLQEGGDFGLGLDLQESLRHAEGFFNAS